MWFVKVKAAQVNESKALQCPRTCRRTKPWFLGQRTMTLYLKAVVEEGKEILRDGISQRYDLRMHHGKVYFGRNSSTGIADENVARKECLLGLDEDGLIEVSYVKSQVWVNGIPVPPLQKHTLRENDRITLRDGRYPYVVCREGAAPPAAPAVAPATAALSPARSPGRKRNATRAALDATPEISQSTLDEFHCAICFEIQVQPTALVPCGHTFCSTCSQAAECAVCREKVQMRVPNIPLNNVISDFTEQDPSPFKTDDIGTYRERTQGTGGTAPRRRTRQASGNTFANAICID